MFAVKELSRNLTQIRSNSPLLEKKERKKNNIPLLIDFLFFYLREALVAKRLSQPH